MLLDLSLKNVRHSLKDYAIYFLTMVIGVSLFYAFNAIHDQSAVLTLSAERGRAMELMNSLLNSVSIFVAIVLGLLIVYANRFLMKRRNGEFAIYMLLGMDKSRVSGLLVLETALVGVLSMGVGLLLGVGISQLMGVLIMHLFEADVSAYHFVVSSAAIGKTVVNFLLMYGVVMLLNNRSVSRMKLIDLLHCDKQSEPVKLKNPALCSVVFLIGAGLLALVYAAIGWNSRDLNTDLIGVYVAVIGLGTFLVFRALSGILLRVAMSRKGAYYHGLNTFTFRQISSKISTVVFSMTVICMMLFMTICTLSSAFAVRNGMNAGAELIAADFEVREQSIIISEYDEPVFHDITARYADYGVELPAHFCQSAHVHTYRDISTKIGSKAVGKDAEVMRLSDYNALMDVYGKEHVELEDNQFVLLCDSASHRSIYDKALKKDTTATVLGQPLVSKYAAAQEGSYEVTNARSNTGLFIIPDTAADESYAFADLFVGNYAASDDAQKAAIEAQVQKEYETVCQRQNEEDGNYYLNLSTRQSLMDSSVGIGALLTIIGLYLGMIFLIASGAVLALRQLSESVDSIPRYEILEKIGADDKEIDRSLFRQTGIFFLMPLLLAGLHSFFGMRFTTAFITLVGTEGVVSSIALTLLVILLIYGGYFYLSYSGSRAILRGNR